MIRLSVPEIEGGSPERDGGGEEEEGQVWGNSRRLDVELLVIASHDKFTMSCLVVIYAVLAQNKFCRDLHTFVWSKN